MSGLSELSDKVQEALDGAPMVEVKLNEHGAHVLIWDGQEEDPERQLVMANTGSTLDLAVEYTEVQWAETKWAKEANR